jgi:hypothetical protein
MMRWRSILKYYTNKSVQQLSYLAAVLVLGAFSVFASPVVTGVAVVDDDPVFNGTDPFWYESDDLNHLEARQDTTVVDCGNNILFSAYKAGYRTFIDSIPNTVLYRRDIYNGLVSYVARFNNIQIQAYITFTGGDRASGENIRRMLHRGYSECVLTGRNDVVQQRERFFNYRVYNPGYSINAGSGIPACRGGANGGECIVLPNPP